MQINKKILEKVKVFKSRAFSIKFFSQMCFKNFMEIKVILFLYSVALLPFYIYLHYSNVIPVVHKFYCTFVLNYFPYIKIEINYFFSPYPFKCTFVSFINKSFIKCTETIIMSQSLYVGNSFKINF